MISLAIIHSGGANLASVRNAFARLGVEAAVSRDPDIIRSASHVVLPGVGAAGDAMHRLRDTGLAELIPSLRQPLLGICLGMQLLYEHSNEGKTPCLGVLSGRVTKLDGDPDHTVPHTGWNLLLDVRQHPVLRGIDTNDRFYFVHGFAAPANSATVACSDHGERFAAASARDNFFGVQFHPERSGAVGAHLLKNFLEWDGCN